MSSRSRTTGVFTAVAVGVGVCGGIGVVWLAQDLHASVDGDQARLAAAQVSTATPAPTIELKYATGAPDAALLTPHTDIANMTPAEQRIAALSMSRTTNKKLGSNVAVEVTDVDSGRIVWSHNGKRLMMPASNLKLLTAAHALDTMGVKKRFTTRVVQVAPGHIAIVGAGDPALDQFSVKQLADRVAKQLKAKGQTGKTKVSVDLSRYPTPTNGNGWPKATMPWTARPVVPLAMTGYMGKDPAKDTANVLAKQLSEDGITASYGGRVRTTASNATVASFQGRDLRSVVKYMLQTSDNNTAEMLGRESAIATGFAPTWAGAQKAIVAYMDSIGLDHRGQTIMDSSGLSRKNRVSSVLLNTILLMAHNKAAHPELSVIYTDGLPVSGKSGTLSSGSDRFVTKDTKCAVGKVRAKTGSLEDVIGLSGYAQGADGKQKAFSILVNQRPKKYWIVDARQQLDRIAATIVGCF